MVKESELGQEEGGVPQSSIMTFGTPSFFMPSPVKKIQQTRSDILGLGLLSNSNNLNLERK